MKKILALYASNSPESINKQLSNYAASLVKEAEVEHIDLSKLDTLPIYSPARQEANGVPQEIQDLYKQIGEADGLILTSAEHNGMPPTFLKNIIDWISRIEMGFFQNKAVVFLSTSPGPNGGATNLSTLATLSAYWSAQVIGKYALGSFGEKFDTANGVVSDEEAATEITSLISQLEKAELATA